MGVRADFHFSPSAYVKMLSLSPSQVSPLQMAQLSVRNGLPEGGRRVGRREGETERKSGKISILNKKNFVMLSPDYHGSSFAMFPNFPSPFASAESPSLQLPAFILLKNSLRQRFRPEFLHHVVNYISQPCEFSARGA